MNKINEKTAAPCGMVQVPEEMLAQMYADIHELVQMHRKLIALYEEETELKKSHRAYLHVRDHADALCKLDKKRIAEIHGHYTEPEQEKEQPEVFGVLILPCDDEADNCSNKAVNMPEAEAAKDGEALIRMLLGALSELIANQQ